MSHSRLTAHKVDKGGLKKLIVQAQCVFKGCFSHSSGIRVLFLHTKIYIIFNSGSVVFHRLPDLALGAHLSNVKNEGGKKIR